MGLQKEKGTDGKVETYKACMIAKGYHQHYDIDYDDTFSSMTILKSIWIVLAIAAYLDCKIWQIDVKIAFLNEELNEEIYIITI